jgi:hypothetical protein
MPGPWVFSVALRVTTDEYNALCARTGAGSSVTPAAPHRRPSKYHNKRVTIGEHTFDSKAEARRYVGLMAMQQGGLISDLRVHPRFELVVNGHHICNYVADFAYIEDGNEVVEDVKGVRTPVYLLKKKLLYGLYGIEVKEVR